MIVFIQHVYGDADSGRTGTDKCGVDRYGQFIRL